MKQIFNKKIISILLSLSFVISFIPLQTFAIEEPITDEDVIITFTTDNIDQNVVNFIRNNNGIVTWKPEELRSISATIPSNIMDDIKTFSTVKYLEKDSIMKIQAQTQDWGIAKTKTPTAWGLNYTGKGVKIAVLDSGISPHEDLLISGGISKVSYTTSYADDNGHGTHVAGIIGAKNNSIGTVGVAPDSEIYAVKVMRSDGIGDTSGIIAGIDWAIANNMDIINMSLGAKSESLALKDAVIRATNAGVIVVAAAGNDGNASATGDTVNYPGRYSNVITVAATDSNNAKASFSSAGPAVDIAAPGASILSTLNTGGYGYMSGTSMATPYVAGIIALYKEAYPNYNTTQLQAILSENVIDLGVSGKDNSFGLGLAQSPTAKGSEESPIAPNTPQNFISSNVTLTSATLSWEAVNGATMYELKRNGVSIYTGKNTSFTNGNLTQGTKYSYTVTAKNVGGVSQPATIDVTTKMPALGAITTLTLKPNSKSVQVTWNKVTNATNYELKRDNVVIYSGNATTFTDTNLTSGTKYTYEVTAMNANGTGFPLVKQTTTTPSAPTNVAETHTTNSAKLTWNSVASANNYQVKDNKTGKIIYKGVNTYYNLTNLLSGVSYSYTIYAGNVSGLGDGSIITVVTTPTIPATPILSSSKVSQSSVTLLWKSIYNAISYEVKRNGITIYTGNALTFTDSNLISGQAYSYTITAKNEVGTSNALSVSKTTIPATPTGLKGTPTTNSNTVSWNTVSGATYYILNNNGKQVYKGASTSYVNTGLLSGIGYNYTVIAGNTSGMSPASSAVTVTTVPTAPSSPSFISVLPTDTSMTISWKGIYNAKSYELKRNGVVVYSGSLLKFADIGLTPGHEYTYTIMAKNDVGNSPTLTTKKYTKPATPTGLKGTPTTNSNTVSWNTVSGATYYILKNNGKQIYKGTSTSYVNSGLLSGIAYKYTVIAGNDSGMSLESPISTFTTVPTAPSSSSFISVSPTETSMTISWKGIYNAKSYELARNGVVVYSGPLLKFVDKGLSAGQEYTYTIMAKNDIGNSPILTTKKLTKPATPTGLKVTSTTKSISISWDSVSGASYYVLRANNKIIYQGTSTSYIHDGLLSGVGYLYTVTAGNVSGVSGISPVFKATTTPTSPSKPTINKISVSKTYALVYWNSIYNATSYTLKRNGVEVYTGNLLNFKDSGLTAGQTYTYTLEAKNSVGTSPLYSVTIKTPN